MRRIKIEKELELQFNRGNPDSPVPPANGDRDMTGDDNQITGVKSIDVSSMIEEKNKKVRNQKNILENEMENTEKLTF